MIWFLFQSVKPVVECSDRDLSSNFTLRTTVRCVVLVYMRNMYYVHVNVCLE